jgi:HAD superfamily hydrolase (TIGR01549 family)
VGAVIFDLDGTLTEPYFDFDAIRREIGLPTEPKTPILEALEQMTADQRARAEEILHRHEEEGARASELREQAWEVVEAIRRRSIPVGVLTRNSRRSLETFIVRHGLEFDCLYAREDGPIKPSPESVLDICRRLGVSPATAWVVGDHQFDLQAGNSAGATTVLMIGEGPRPDFAHRADYVIRRLKDLLCLLSIPAK